MINTVIIEDEFPAAERLEKILKEVANDIEVITKIDSVSVAVKWLNENDQPDLLMLDIQLGDGLSFDIFKQVSIDSFVIFTTAYDEYAIKAFELNSVDYLLKPIDKEKLASSIEKFRSFKQSKNTIPIDDILASIASKSQHYKKRFAINIGARIKSVDVSSISYFESIEKSTFLHTTDNHTYPVDFSLDKLEKLLDPGTFFRINRQVIIQFKAISKINILSKSRIQVSIDGARESFLISSAKSHSFRNWLDK